MKHKNVTYLTALFPKGRNEKIYERNKEKEDRGKG
jgi:hypothetical protein